MLRTIVKIEEDKCIGCKLCVNACHMNAIIVENGKARLIREDYCDGLGKCLPACPADAISVEEREAPEFDKKAVKIHLVETRQKEQSTPSAKKTQLNQWPIQLKLVPVTASFFDGADLLVAADCAAYAHGDFHNEYMKDRAMVLGCPKLDSIDYSEKLTAIIKSNDIKSVSVVRMSVPCCGGIEFATKDAVKNSGKQIPLDIVTLSTDGKVLS